MFLQHYNMFLEVMKLPRAELHFAEWIDPADIKATYRNYTKPHPRYKIIGHKTIGAALVDLSAYPDRNAYLDAIKGKNQGAYHAKRARSRGYVVCEINRNDYVDDIHAINTSLDTRQGRPMDQKYTEKTHQFDQQNHFRYWGVLNPEGKLVAYASLGIYGNFASFSQMMGIRNNDGIMHLLLSEAICQLIDAGEVRYVMYDTFFGAQPGLRNFKTILGFRPYRASYSLQ
ncbi:hypothetical protein [Massilia yuzhufengensis]|uniref:N-acetyltransferase domain-containing protein n=1 Tax=Massilia yuzhufengensis TaxID=1164594 RepID=A0A1I1EJ19_9BURK|nr:hypothetical protein [Massilia yuzhufengensis]SFB85428.1 hypothetical protein SAMN05216204_10294 [Massilia yuzhufengensis]